MGNNCCQEKEHKKFIEDDQESEIMFEMKDSEVRNSSGYQRHRHSKKIKLQRIENEAINGAFYQKIDSYYLGDIPGDCALGFKANMILTRTNDAIHQFVIENSKVIEVGFIQVPHYGYFTDILYCASRRCFFTKMTHFDKMVIMKLDFDKGKSEIVIDETNVDDSNDLPSIGSFALSYMEDLFFTLKKDRISIYSIEDNYECIKNFDIEAQCFRIIDNDKFLVLENSPGNVSRVSIIKYSTEKDKESELLHCFDLKPMAPGVNDEDSKKLFAFEKESLPDEINVFSSDIKISNYFNYVGLVQYDPGFHDLHIRLYDFNQYSMELQTSLILKELDLNSFRFNIFEFTPHFPIIVIVLNFRNASTELRTFSIEGDKIVPCHEEPVNLFSNDVWGDLYIWGEELFCVADDNLKIITFN